MDVPRFVFQICGAGDYWSVATEDGPVFAFVREYEVGRGYQIGTGAWFPTLESAARELWIRKRMRERVRDDEERYRPNSLTPGGWLTDDEGYVRFWS